MAKITKSSFQLGWTDGIERKVGRNLSLNGIDAEAYMRGVERANEFRRRISAQRTPERLSRSLLDEAAE
jgi:hypothetical protein